MLMPQINKKKLAYFLILLLSEGVLFGLSNPAHAPALLLVTGFIMLVATFYFFTLFCIWLITSGRPSRLVRKAGWLLTIFVAFLLAMQSIGELVWYDILALLPLLLILFLYLSYATTES